ncbi:MAG: hypothetical protein K2X48_15550 [Chitinophagaceae bacterium]|nr:hypothetical protein [Chitinophagaceae bacterium]
MIGKVWIMSGNLPENMISAAFTISLSYKEVKRLREKPAFHFEHLLLFSSLPDLFTKRLGEKLPF